jgi:hypothetical protein
MQPESMRVVDNIQPADNEHKNDWFPYGGILTITTSDPQNTQFVTVEIKDQDNNLVEVAQVDPEFDSMHQMVHLKIQTSWEDLEGQMLTLVTAWSDASGEEYRMETQFQCV